MEHKDALQRSVVGALGNVEAFHEVVPFGIDNLPGVPHEVVVRINAAGGQDIGPRCGGLIASDALGESVDAPRTSGRVDQFRVVGDGAFE